MNYFLFKIELFWSARSDEVWPTLINCFIRSEQIFVKFRSIAGQEDREITLYKEIELKQLKQADEINLFKLNLQSVERSFVIDISVNTQQNQIQLLKEKPSVT